MEAKAYPAFGYVIVKNTVPTGGKMNSELVTDNRYSVQNPSPYEDGDYNGTKSGSIWLYTEGRTATRNLNTGVTKQYSAGWSNLVSPQEVGEFEFVVEEPLTLFCLGAVDNRGKVPVIPRAEYFSLEAGRTSSFSVGTKLFLCHGDMLINERVFSGPRQVKVVSEEITVIAKTTCYGLLFP